MPPSADAFPGRTDRVEAGSAHPSVGVPPPRSAPEVESTRAPSPVAAPPDAEPPVVPEPTAPQRPGPQPSAPDAPAPDGGDAAPAPEVGDEAPAPEVGDALPAPEVGRAPGGEAGAGAVGAAPAEESTVAEAGGLTERERRILAFERHWWRHAGAKEQAIRDTFALSATRYYQLLNGLLDNPAALAAEPLLIGRLRRLRSSRARNRRR